MCSRFRWAIFAILLLGFGVFASLRWTWWWYSDTSFSDKTRNRLDTLSEYYFRWGVNIQESSFSEKPIEERQSAANYAAYRCAKDKPVTIQERAEWCLHAHLISLLDPRKRRPTAKIAEQINAIAARKYVWAHAEDSKDKAAQLFEYVQYSHALLALASSENKIALKQSLRDCFVAALKVIGFFEVPEMVDALVELIKEEAENSKEDFNAYEAEVAESIPGVRKDEDHYFLRLPSGSDFQLLIGRSAGEERVTFRRRDQPTAFATFKLTELPDLIATGKLDDMVQDPDTRLGVGRINWLRAPSLKFPSKGKTAAICVVADSGGRVIGSGLAVRILRAVGLKDLHGHGVINHPPFVGSADIERIDDLVEEALEDREVTQVYLDLVAHGNKEGVVLSESSPIDAEDLVTLVERHPEITFIVTTAACYSGDLALELERILSEYHDSGLTPRLTLITHSAPGSLTLVSQYGGYFSLVFLKCLYTRKATFGYGASLAATVVRSWNTPMILHHGKLNQL